MVNSDLLFKMDVMMPSHRVEMNSDVSSRKACRPALPFDVAREFESATCVPPLLSAVVAHLKSFGSNTAHA